MTLKLLKWIGNIISTKIIFLILIIQKFSYQ